MGWSRGRHSDSTRLGVLLLLMTIPAAAVDRFDNEDLLSLSLEELMEVEVTSVSKRPERQRDAAAAVFVLTAEDIRRSGATSIPDVLRLVPGVEVARLDSHTWGITSRGFNNVFSDKLLVLIDGRSVYTPLFAGVFWDQQDVMLQDVERIEVIRGPGGTLWGANAVNGVINIITKPASETQGGLISAGGGTEDLGAFALRYGGEVKNLGHHRLSLKYFNRDAGEAPDGGDGADDWQQVLLDTRIDLRPSDRDTLTIGAAYYDGRYDNEFTAPRSVFPFTEELRADDETRGAHIRTKWTRKFGDGSSLTTSAYWDYTERFGALTRETRHTLDIESQYRRAWGNGHLFVTGVGARHSRNTFNGDPSLQLDPNGRGLSYYNLFAQNEFRMLDERLRLTLGSKFSFNEFTDFEVQPNVRLSWAPDNIYMLWGSISRAVRTPAQVDTDIRLGQIGFPGGLFGLYGQDDQESESLIAYELGARIEPLDNLFFDVALFYNDYDDIRTGTLGFPRLVFNEGFLPVLVIPALTGNAATAENYGIEFVVDWRPVSWWRLRAIYSYLRQDVSVETAPFEFIASTIEGTSPEHQVGLESRMDLPKNVELDLTAKYVDELPHLGIDSYIDLDVRIGWNPKPALSLSVVGQNLLDDSREEFSRTFLNSAPTGNERGVYAQLEYRF